PLVADVGERDAEPGVGEHGGVFSDAAGDVERAALCEAAEMHDEVDADRVLDAGAVFRVPAFAVRMHGVNLALSAAPGYDWRVIQDSHGRAITNCRISVTDRCNLRCVYCMPENPTWLPQDQVLTFE